MASLKYYRNRIIVLRNMQKVMHAMRMIATIKMHKLLRFQQSLTVFEQSLEQMSRDIMSAFAHLRHPLTKGVRNVKKSHVIILSADRGMCGSHNSSVYKALDLFALQCMVKRRAFEVTSIGNRGINYCKRKEFDIFHQSEINEHSFTGVSVFDLATTLVERFLKNDIQEIYVIANYYISAIHQQCMTTRLIPFTVPKEPDKKIPAHEAETEPKPDKFIVEAARLYVSYKVLSALYNSYLSEHAARMTAMENATANSEELIRHYIKLRNRARQASITNALMEIISGKEALKG